jgi:hypothetical protein
MKICIITVYNSLNCGSFLQAYALMKILQEKGHDVVFLKTGVKKPGIETIKEIVKSLLKFNLSEALFYAIKYLKFNREHKIFNTLPFRRRALKTCDLFIFGSDEIWNVARKDFAKYPILWGHGIPYDNFIAYAPSINKSTLEHLKSTVYPEECLSRFKSIMVRDKHSKEVLSKLTKKQIDTVVDPTLLLESKEYKIPDVTFIDKEYILLYSYGTYLDNNRIKIIREFAKRNNLLVISACRWFEWVDKNIAATPCEFLKLMKDAKFVITDTFHGTLFSIILSKKFVSIADNNIKVLELLNLLEMESRILNNSSEIDEIITAEIDYQSVNKRISYLRDKSLISLFDSIDIVNQNYN